MQTFIRFEGFYYSTLDQIFDNAAERDIEYRLDENPDVQYEHDWEAISDAAEKYRHEAGKMIFDLLAGELKRQGAEISFSYAGIDSPREYNFSTDQLRVNYDADHLGQFWQACRHSKPRIVAGFFDFVAEHLKPRSGFIPFYSNDLRRWGLFAEWDHMQHALLIEFLTQRANSFFNSDFWQSGSEYWDTDGIEYSDADCFMEALDSLAYECLPEPVPVVESDAA